MLEIVEVIHEYRGVISRLVFLVGAIMAICPSIKSLTTYYKMVEKAVQTNPGYANRECEKLEAKYSGKELLDKKAEFYAELVKKNCGKAKYEKWCSMKRKSAVQMATIMTAVAAILAFLALDSLLYNILLLAT